MSTDTKLLDSTVCGTFLPYRDGAGRPRLLDLSPQHKPSAQAAKLYRRLATAYELGTQVDSDAAYKQWWASTMRKLYTDITDAMRTLGCCMGNEGRHLADLSSEVVSAVHRPGWRCE